MAVKTPFTHQFVFIQAAQFGNRRKQAVVGFVHLRAELRRFGAPDLVRISQFGSQLLPCLIHRLPHHFAPHFGFRFDACRLGLALQRPQMLGAGIAAILHITHRLGGQLRLCFGGGRLPQCLIVGKLFRTHACRFRVIKQ